MGAAPRLSLLYAALFLQIGVTMPFFALWLDAKGLSAGEIAATLAAPQLLRVFTTPALAYAADRFRARKRVLLGCLAASLAGFVALGLQGAAWPIILLYALASAGASAAMPLTEATTLRVAVGGRLDYGRVRLWGSLAFILASLTAGGIVQAFAADRILWLVVAAAGLALGAGLVMPRSDGPAGQRPPASRPLRLLANSRLLALLLGGSFVQASHAVYYTFASLQWHDQGFAGVVIGALWAWAVLCEIGLFWASGRLFRHGSVVPLAVGAAVGVLRWTAMSLDPPLAALIVLQAGHAASFAAAHLGAIRAAARVRPELQATAQSLYAALNGLAMAGATAAAGPLYRAYGPGAYLGAAALAALGFALVIGAAMPSRGD